MEMLPASLSIPSNISVGSKRNSMPDFQRFFQYSNRERPLFQIIIFACLGLSSLEFVCHLYIAI
ncbi:MAG: four helix bundle protein [Colwellia sp.]|nr:four helix bundle protein [Colwellia sp.]